MRSFGRAPGAVRRVSPIGVSLGIMRNLPQTTPMLPRCFALLAVFATACGTTYTPAYSDRIAYVTGGSGYAPALVVRENRFRLGPFGGDVDEAVRGVPRAEAEMATFQSEQTAGTIVALAGILALPAGELIDLAAGPNRTVVPAYAGVITGIVAVLTGLFLQLAARDHLFDAINIYNDTVAPFPVAAPCATPRAGSPALRP